MPFFHAYGTVGSILAAMHYGSTLVLPTDGYNVDRNLEAIAVEKFVFHLVILFYIRSFIVDVLLYMVLQQCILI